MSSPEDSDFVKDAFAEIPELELRALDGNEEVKKLLSSQETTIGVVNYSGIEIRYRVFIPKSLRHKMLRTKVMLDQSKDENSLSLSERSMYEILGGLCLDSPWNKWETWAYVDENLKDTGAVQNIFIQILSRIGSEIEDVKNFRRK